MSKYFTHLHLHTDYSLLDGAISIEKLVKFGQENNLKSLAISDHGNIFGAVKFFQKCKSAGIKPVLGIEAYLTKDIGIKDKKEKYYHLLLLVKNEVGYRNLCRLLHIAYTKGFYYKPRIDYALLEAHSEGLISSTTCLGGHIPQLLLHKKEEEALVWFDRMLSIFGEDNYFIEVHPDDQEEQKIVNKKLFELSDKKGIPVFAAADCHYYSEEDRFAHEVMLAIQTRHKMTDDDRMTFGDCRAHLRTEKEMLELFNDRQESVWRSGEIADRCNFDFKTGKLFFPKFEVPNNENEKDYFVNLCQKGLKKLFESGRIKTDKPEVYWERLRNEMDLIINMGFVTYFLIVGDFMQWARSKSIPANSRGSVAGSLVAWALEITNINPIKYGLLFERFLNPERVTMPDIDIDFCIEGRERVINYVKDCYGHDKVCQIITFGSMMAKGVVKDVARALGIPFEDANAITDLIPDRLKITLKEALDEEPKLKKLSASNPKISQMFDIATRLEGLTRHASKHAAGLVITPEPIKEMLPVYVPPKTNDLVTQYAMTELESLGFLKIDFLGLKNLTLIRNVIELIKENHGETIDPENLALDNKATFELISRGDSTGVFQLESSGMRDILRRLKLEVVEDIIAVIALYRPGPLGSGMVDDFIECRHGRAEVKYLFDELEPLLKETYGVIVYQEQVMQIASTIADYSLGEADVLRRAMGKKKFEVMAEQREKFVGRAKNKGFDEKKSGELFDLLAYFAGYGFNKSHSAAYGMITYQTAYLKANYPMEFMASLISLETKDPEKMAFYLREARDMGIEVLPPDINESEISFTTRKKAIRFGLRGIKSVGVSALEICITDREKNGSFKDLMDFCFRVDTRFCNKRVIENFIAAGAFDCLGGNRAQKTEELPRIMKIAAENKEDARTGQMRLFEKPESDKKSDEEVLYRFSPRDDWDDAKKLEKEKEMLGLYISALPLDRYSKQLEWLRIKSFKNAFEEGGLVTCSGSTKNLKIVTTKRGDRMAFLELEDYEGSAEVVVFPRLFERVAESLKSNIVFVVKGLIDETSTTSCKIKANEVVPIDLIFEDWSLVEKVTLTFPDGFESEEMGKLKENFIAGRTELEMIFKENDKTLKLRSRKKFACNLEVLLEMDKNGIKIELAI